MSGVTILEAVYDPTGQVADFRYVLTNPTNARYAYKEPHQMIGQLWSTIFPDVQQTDFYHTALQVFSTGTAVRKDIYYHQEGLNVWLDVQFLAHPKGVMFIFLDVTQSRQHQLLLEEANQKLVQVNHQLQVANQYLEQFAYTASHDLQEPLRKIMAFGDLLTQEYVQGLSPQGSTWFGACRPLPDGCKPF